jgi:ABC-type glucose/galactose transport system permease subunit
MKRDSKGIRIPLRFIIGKTIIAGSIEMKFSDLPMHLQGKCNTHDFVDKLWEDGNFQETLGEYQAELGTSDIVALANSQVEFIDNATSFGRNGFEILGDSKASKLVLMSVNTLYIISAVFVGYLLGAY